MMKHHGLYHAVNVINVFDEKKSDEASCAVTCVKCDKRFFDVESAETHCAKILIECEKRFLT